MKVLYLILMASILAMVSTAAGQNPIEAVASSLQEQMNTAGKQLQDKAVQHILDGNLTQEHIAQDLNATKDNLTEQAKATIDENLNITAEQLTQKAEEELKKRAAQELQKQPGFQAAFAILATLAAVGLMRRRS